MRRVLLLAAALAIVNAFPGAHSRGAASLQEIPVPPPPSRKVVTLESGIDARLWRVERWLKAVLHHRPGEPDEAATEVSGWSNREMRTLWIDINVLVKLIRNPKATSFTLRADGQSRSQDIHYAPADLRRLQVLACGAGGQVGRGAQFDNPRDRKSVV